MDEKFFTEYFENYARAYDDFNAEALAQYFPTPTLMVKKGSVVGLSTIEELLEHLNGKLASDREQGYKQSQLAGLEMHKEGAWGVTVTVHWMIDHVDGSTLRDFYTTYNLLKQASQWRILVTTDHPA